LIGVLRIRLKGAFGSVIATLYSFFAKRAGNKVRVKPTRLEENSINRMIDFKEMRSLVFAIVDERFGDDVPGGLRIDLVNLDRGGEGGLVYLDGEIVRRGPKTLDGMRRLEAVEDSWEDVELPVAQFEDEEDDPIPGAIYVQKGPTPDYLIDRASHTILIGWKRGERSARTDEIRTAITAAVADLFGN
jgi:hypothetical protein